MSVTYDVAIIGSGFGGLIAGALLAKKGFKVAVIEQHDKVGGFASHFKRKNYTFEVAVHLMDGPSENNFRTNIFNYLDFEKKINFVNIPNFFGVHTASGLVEVPANIPKAKEHLITKFPAEKMGILTFFETMEKISDEFSDFLKREPPIRLKDPFFGMLYPNFQDLSHITIAEYVYSLVKNNDLRWILMANLGFYYHDLNFPASAYLVNQANYFNGGVRYVKGGVQNVSNAIAEIITSVEGSIFLKSAAEEILIENNKVAGVAFRKTLGENKELQLIKSKYVIANAAVPFVYSELLKNKIQPDKMIYPPGSQHSISATTVYLGLNKPFHELTPASFFNFYREKDPFHMIGSKNKGRDFSLVDYSVVDDTFNSSKKFTSDIVFLDQESQWDDAFKRGLYKDGKSQMTDEIIKWLNKLNPNFKNHIEVVELGTPRTVEKFTRNTHGAIYGFNASTMDLDTYCERLRINFEPKDQNIENLYFASAWSSCQSISGVTTAGYQAARSILKNEGIDLRL